MGKEETRMYVGLFRANPERPGPSVCLMPDTGAATTNAYEMGV
jgi:hypothetical protein